MFVITLLVYLLAMIFNQPQDHEFVYPIFKYIMLYGLIIQVFLCIPLCFYPKENTLNKFYSSYVLYDAYRIIVSIFMILFGITIVLFGRAVFDVNVRGGILIMLLGILNAIAAAMITPFLAYFLCILEGVG